MRQKFHQLKKNRENKHLGAILNEDAYKVVITRILHLLGQSLVEHLEIRWCVYVNRRCRCSDLHPHHQTEWNGYFLADYSA